MITVSNREKCKINDGMFGLFFEDINYGLDGGLHAEMIENRSFEFFDCGGKTNNWYKSFDGLYGWSGDEQAKLEIGTAAPLNDINPHYLKFTAGRDGAAFTNKAYDGITLKAGMDYNISFYARIDAADEDKVNASRKLNVEIRKSFTEEAVCTSEALISSEDWQKIELSIHADVNADGAAFCISALNAGIYDFDFISMKPADAVYGVFRKDLADALKDLHPGFLRFPGGCVVEGNTLDNMYKWKLSVGAPETRKANWNRWAVHQNNGHGPFAHYNQSLGVGYYEYFMLCEYIGAKPLPVCNVGLACQFESNQRFEIEDDIFCCFVQDALDLIEFANGSSDTKWGALRAEMGHPEPFNLELVGIGNEQWETPESRFFKRYTIFEAAIHEQYPEIKLIGSAGPDVTSERYTAAWNYYRDAAKQNSASEEYKFAYAIDEHYYVPPKWMLSNNHFYDNYSRDIKVFAGEYAAHVGEDSKSPSRNCVEGAVSEAAFMTGLERNADVVVLASYAPLFARDGYVQWAPDMIWFNDRVVSLTPSYYVQKIYATKTGDSELVIEGLDEAENRGVFASASRDSRSGKHYIKLINSNENPIEIEIGFDGVDVKAAEILTLSGDKAAYNSVEAPLNVVPVSSGVDLASGKLVLKAMSVNVIEF